MLSSDDPRVVELADVIARGDIERLTVLLRDHPDLATQRHGSVEQSRTALHVATDWPGHFPRVAESIAMLVAAGAPLDGRFAGPHTETPLHWAASSNDVVAIDALLDAGADIEADGAVFTNGTALSDAVVFAQYDAARRLVERGASMTLWQAAALGHLDVVTGLLPDASPADVTNACWHACRAGQSAVVALLHAQGADLDWLGYDGLTCRAAGLASGNPELVAFLRAP